MNMLNFCETGRTVYSPYPKRLERLTIFGCHYKRRHFLLSYFKTLRVGPARVELTTSHMAVFCMIVCLTLCHFGSGS